MQRGAVAAGKDAEMPESAVQSVCRLTPSYPRAFAVAVAHLAMIGLFILLPTGFALHAAIFVAGFLLTVSPLVALALKMQLTCEIDARGFTSRSMFGDVHIAWSEVSRVDVGIPFVFYMVRTKVKLTGFRFMPAPDLRLVKNPEEAREALRAFVPGGNPAERLMARFPGWSSITVNLASIAAAAAFILYIRG